MNRRCFMTVLSSGPVAPQVLNADHYVISADPLEVEFDLSSLQGQYTRSRISMCAITLPRPTPPGLRL